MIKHFDDVYDLFLWYFQNGLDIKKTLRHFNIINGKVDWAHVMGRWAYYKNAYKEEYQKAKTDFYEISNISEVNVINTLADIGFGRLEANPTQLRALELLQKFLETSNDSKVLNAAQRLVIEVIGESVTASQEEVSDIPGSESYEGEYNEGDLNEGE